MSRLVFLPVFKVQLEIQVKHGRRWTPLEHLILWALSNKKRTVAELSAEASAPPRVVVECLINLMRQGWIEVQDSRSGVFFMATTEGGSALTNDELPYDFRYLKRFRTFCLERLGNTLIRPDALRLMHYQKVNDLAAVQNAVVLGPAVFKAVLRPQEILDQLILEQDDQFQAWLDDRVLSANLYAVLRVIGGQIDGLPQNVEPRLVQLILDRMDEIGALREDGSYASPKAPRLTDAPRFRHGQIHSNDLIVGGEDHLAEFRRILETARSYIIVHTTFMAPGAVSRLLPEIEEAAKARDIEIDIIWGERDTPGQSERNATAIQASRIETHFRSRHMDNKVRVAHAPTDSHCKLILSDSSPDGQFEAVVGSCNWLSSAYINAEISVRVRNRLLVRDLANAFATLLMPASGRWDRSVMRLVMIGEECRLGETAESQSESGAMVLFDDDHYAAIRDARDNAMTRIVAGCDWLGGAAETSVFVPTRTAAQEGLREVLLLYQRADERTSPTLEQLRSDLQKAGIILKELAGLHGKFLVWDSDNAAITSFNWLSTAIRGYQQGASEIGLLINAPGIGDALLAKLSDLDGVALAVTDQAQELPSTGGVMQSAT